MDDILEILIQDARKSPAEIAEMTGKSEKEVADAIADYEKKGTILKYRAVLNPQEVAGFVSQKLSTLENVTATSTHFMLKVYKENGDVFQNTEKSERLAISL